MGSQCHNFALGILLNDDNYEYLYNNYIALEVKHYEESHGDFRNEGIYGIDNEVLRQFIIRGPVENIQELIFLQKRFIKNLLKSINFIIDWNC